VDVSHFFLVSLMVVEVRVLELERRVNILSKALNLILFEEGEALAKEEIDELKARLNEYLEKRSDFVSFDELLEDVQGNTAQESPKGDRVASR